MFPASAGRPGIALALACACLATAQAEPTATPADANRPVAFDVVLPLRNRNALEGYVADLQNPASPNYHRWLSPAEFGLRFAPPARDMENVASAFQARGFSVSMQTRSLHVAGTAAQVQQHLGTPLLVARTRDGSPHVLQARMPVLPPEIAATGGQIFSFSPHSAHRHAHVVTARLDPASRLGPAGGYWFTDLRQAYAYPSVRNVVQVPGGATHAWDGTGATIAVLMSSDVYDSDIQAMFDHEEWTLVSGRPTPKLFARVYVDGGATTASPALDEASLDTQQVLAGAPGAHVVLYDIPDLSDGSIIAGYISIIEGNQVDLVTSSFGGCERGYSPSFNGGQSFYGVLAAEHELFLQGNAQGITFLASSGDSAGKACPAPAYFVGQNTSFLPGVEYPASDPDVTAVGGTNLVTSSKPGSLDSTYLAENGWSDPEVAYDPDGLGPLVSGGFWGAGGGYSGYFPRPAWQSAVNTGSTSRRAVPDIGMQVGGCPGGIAKLNRGACNGGNLKQNGAGNSQRSFVIVSIAGEFHGVIGTSVAAPELAGATALLIERYGRLGNLNPYLYQLASLQAANKGVFFHTNIPGFNGLAQTNLNAAYSLTTGVGTPMVNIYTTAGAVELSGTPMTATNP